MTRSRTSWPREETEILIRWMEANVDALRGKQANWHRRVKDETELATMDHVSVKRITDKAMNMRKAWKDAKDLQRRSGWALTEEENEKAINDRLEKRCQFFWRLDGVWGPVGTKRLNAVSRPTTTPTTTTADSRPAQVPSASTVPVPAVTCMSAANPEEEEEISDSDSDSDDAPLELEGIIPELLDQSSATPQTSTAPLPHPPTPLSQIRFYPSIPNDPGRPVGTQSQGRRSQLKRILDDVNDGKDSRAAKRLHLELLLRREEHSAQLELLREGEKADMESRRQERQEEREWRREEREAEALMRREEREESMKMQREEREAQLKFKMEKLEAENRSRERIAEINAESQKQAGENQIRLFQAIAVVMRGMSQTGDSFGTTQRENGF